MSAASVKARDLIDRVGSTFKARDVAAYLVASAVAENQQPNADTVQAFRLLDRLVSVRVTAGRNGVAVHTDDADLTDPRTTFAAWDVNGVICTDECDGSREQAEQHAREFIAANPEAVHVHVYAFTPADA